MLSTDELNKCIFCHKTVPDVIYDLRDTIKESEMDKEIDRVSAEFAYDFSIKLLVFSPSLSPYIDACGDPDGSSAISVRHDDNMLTMRFSDEGTVAWAVYFRSTKQSDKGNFQLKNDIPEKIKAILKRFEKMLTEHYFDPVSDEDMDDRIEDIKFLDLE